MCGLSAFVVCFFVYQRFLWIFRTEEILSDIVVLWISLLLVYCRWFVKAGWSFITLDCWKAAKSSGLFWRPRTWYGTRTARFVSDDRFTVVSVSLNWHTLSPSATHLGPESQNRTFGIRGKSSLSKAFAVVLSYSHLCQLYWSINESIASSIISTLLTTWHL